MTLTLDRPDTQEIAEIRPYPVDNLRKRGGYYVARLNGLDDRYGVAREFLQGKPKGPVFEYGPADIGTLPAWLVRAGATCSGCGRPDPKSVELIAATSIGWQSIGQGFTTRDLIAIVESGPPGPNPGHQAMAALETETMDPYGPEEEPF